jgi:hypothetical protein
VLVAQRAGVIAEQAGLAAAASDADLLLYPLLAHLNAVTLGQPSLVNPLRPSALVAALLR